MCVYMDIFNFTIDLLIDKIFFNVFKIRLK